MNILDIFLQFIVEHLQQLDILVVLSFIIIEIWIVFFPHKFNIPSDCMLFKPSFLFASFFKKIIAQRLLSKKILKELKVPVVPFSQRLSFDEFSEKYVRLYINGKQIIESVYEQIQKGKKRFIFAGGGGRGKTLTAYKLIDMLKDEGYIPIIYRSDFDKDKILENSISLDTQTAKLLQNIFYKKFIFIFDNFDMETFTEASDSCLKEFPESLSVLTSRNASLNNDYNFNDVDKEKLLIGFLLRNQNIESDFTIPLYLAILKKLTSKDYKTKDEIVKQYIEKQNVLLKIRLHLADTMEEDFYQLLEYIYKAIALMAVKSISIKNNKKFREDIVEALSEFDSKNRFEFIYQNLGLNELEFFNELERSSVLYEEKGVFKFIHDILAEYFQRLVANEMVENIDSYSNKQEKLNFITTLDSSNKKVYEELGLIYEKEGNYQKAVEHYYKSENGLKIKEIYGMNKVVISESNWHDLGGLFVKYNLYDQAIEAYQKAIEINPKDDVAYNNMGSAYGNKQAYDQAIEAYQKAIAINPKKDEAYYNMGNAYRHKQAYDQAIKAYQKAIAINPKKDEAYSNMGLVYHHKQAYDQAIEAYQKAIEINPKHDGAYNNMGLAYVNQQAYDQAIEACQKAIEINPKRDGAYNNMGLAYVNQQAYDQAIEAYQKAIEINPKNDDAYNNMGSAYRHKQAYDQAIEAYQKAIEINPKKDVAYYGMGLVYHHKQAYDQAIEAYQKAIEINPKNDDAYNNMGSAYHHKQAYDQAIEAYQKAIEINPKYDKAYYNMGIAYHHKQAYDQAIEAYQKAIEINENKIYPYQALVKVYTILNNHQYALFYQTKLDKAIEKMKGKTLPTEQEIFFGR